MEKIKRSYCRGFSVLFSFSHSLLFSFLSFLFSLFVPVIFLSFHSFYFPFLFSPRVLEGPTLSVSGLWNGSQLWFWLL